MHIFFPQIFGIYSVRNCTLKGISGPIHPKHECIFSFVKNTDLVALMVCVLLVLFCIHFYN